MRALPLALALMLPAPALATVTACRIVLDCQAGNCHAGFLGVTLTVTPGPDGMILGNADNPGQEMTLVPVPGDGPETWVGRSPRVRAVAILTRAPGARMALSIHNDTTPELTVTAHLDCAEAAPPPSK